MIDSRKRVESKLIIDGDKNNHLLKNLTPNTTYNFRLVSYNLKKENASTPTIQVNTHEFGEQYVVVSLHYMGVLFINLHFERLK